MSKKYKYLVRELGGLFLSIVLLNSTFIVGTYLLVCNCISDYSVLGGYIGEFIGLTV